MKLFLLALMLPLVGVAQDVSPTNHLAIPVMYMAQANAAGTIAVRWNYEKSLLTQVKAWTVNRYTNDVVTLTNGNNVIQWHLEHSVTVETEHIHEGPPANHTNWITRSFLDTHVTPGIIYAYDVSAEWQNGDTEASEKITCYIVNRKQIK